jgi:hypothetical protein
MACNLLCGAPGSAAASPAWTAGGWAAVSGLGLGMAALRFGLWALEHVQRPARVARAETVASAERR